MDALMPEVGHVRVFAQAGQFDFVPSLGAFNSLGNGPEIIETAADLFDPRPSVSIAAARCVMRACCVGEIDVAPLVGYLTPRRAVEVPGEMPVPEMLAIARHLVQHGLAGKARPGGGRGGYTQEFSVAQHIAAAVAHLGITREAALAMTMTEMQLLIEAKFPEAKAKEVPTREEYRSQVAAIMARRRGREAAAHG